jgi:hypothetical protein
MQCHGSLVECRAQALGQRDGVVIGPEVAENSRGCSFSMWLCSAVTSIPLLLNVLITGLTSSAVRTKSPVIAALPPPVGWKPMASATPMGPTGASCIPPSLIGSRRHEPA